MRDVVAFDQGDEVGGLVACERGAGEVRVGGEKAIGGCVYVGEVAAAAAGDDDFRADLARVLDHQHALTARAGGERAEEPRRAAADDDGVVSHRC